MAAELQLDSSQEEDRYFSSTDPRGGAHDEDAELSSLDALLLEALIKAVLNSNTEEIDAAESSDCILS